MVFEVLVLSLLVAVNYFPEKPKFSHLSFFFLGAGFMLIETKGITEMGLTFGNTWQVIGFVIAGILTMAFLGNCAVQWLNIAPSGSVSVLVCGPGHRLVCRTVGRLCVDSSGTSGNFNCAYLAAAVFGHCLLDSALSKGQVSGMMAMNLLGAICGGFLEYNSMYFGFVPLLDRLACYLLAFVSELLFAKKDIDELPVASSMIGHENVS